MEIWTDGSEVFLLLHPPTSRIHKSVSDEPLQLFKTPTGFQGLCRCYRASPLQWWSETKCVETKTITGGISQRGNLLSKSWDTISCCDTPLREQRKTINKQINDGNHRTSNKTTISLRSSHDPLQRSLSSL